MERDQTRRLRLYLDDAEAVDDLFRQALRARENQALSEFLNFLARFRRYSLFNAMLIRVQRPGTLAVASWRRWQDYGRTVAPDAVPIVILQPLRAGAVCLRCRRHARPTLPQGAEWGPFSAAGDVPYDAWEKAVSGGAKCGGRIELIDNYGSGWGGARAGRSPHAGPLLQSDSDATPDSGRHN